jgi:prepilin signal peptidase PulO-like enzyme (type II secretory pathway)
VIRQHIGIVIGVINGIILGPLIGFYANWRFNNRPKSYYCKQFGCHLPEPKPPLAVYDAEENGTTYRIYKLRCGYCGTVYLHKFIVSFQS